jgi:SAM-dependent methyltransferase
MFNNLINSEDTIALCKIVFLERKLNKFANIFKSNKKKVIKTWSKESAPGWGSIPLVKKRWNYKISGDVKIDFFTYVNEKVFKDCKNLTALSLGSGLGKNEIALARSGKYKLIDAFDITPFRVERARELAEKSGYSDVVNFYQGDVYNLEIKEKKYDAIFAMGSLHHFSPLTKVLDTVNSLLKDDGCFIIHEYVGPTQFQWTTRQLEIINGLLQILPSKYKIKWSTGKVQKKIIRPSRLRMRLGDPSEAIDSANIIPRLKEKFEIVEFRPFGGTIMHLLLSDIAQNFLPEDQYGKELLKICFDIEDKLIEMSEISSDFVVAVCKKLY